MADSVIDVTDATFEAEVLDASFDQPVVVDFWAPWCGPCRTLGPLLERLARDANGAWRLAKVDIDQSPGVAQSLAIQSIPFVLGFRDGRVVSEFVGAQPEHVVRQFLERLLPDEIDRLTVEAERLGAAGDAAGAEAKLRDVLAQRPGDARAALGLAHVLAGDGRPDEAAAVLENVAAEGELGARIEHLAAELRTRRGGEEDEAALREAVAKDPNDLGSKLALGRLLSARRRHEEALEIFLEVVRRDRDYDDAAARKAMLDIFTLLGRDDPVADRYQRELSRVLFS